MDFKKQIISNLERVSGITGYRSSEVFDDWLEIVRATMESMPGHMKASKEGAIYQDTPETQALFERVNTP